MSASDELRLRADVVAAEGGWNVATAAELRALADLASAVAALRAAMNVADPKRDVTRELNAVFEASAAVERAFKEQGDG